MMTERRNLRLFYIDDRIPPVEMAHIDLVFKGLYGWQTHCRHIFAAPFLEFDLLSVDINFSEDTTDPASADADNNTTWGLIHALTALARRQHHDRVRNRLPLAWEVRSVSPGTHREDVEGLRTYGLLRTLAAMPKDGENIFDCVMREYEESSREALYPASHSLVDTKLDVLFAEDLARQKSHGSEVRDIIDRLLCIWRRRFLEAVRTGTCRLGGSAARNQLAYLKGQNHIVAVGDDGPFVPIGNGKDMEYGIWLVSIFADKLRPDDQGRLTLALNDRFADLAYVEEPDDPVTITEWYGQLVKMGSGAISNPATMLLKVIARANPLIVTDKGDKAPLGALNHELRSSKSEPRANTLFDPPGRGMLLCFLCALSVLESDRPARTLTGLGKQYKIDANERTWRDGIKSNPALFGSLKPSEIAKGIVRAMKGEPEHDLGDIWIWLSEGVARWIKTLPAPKPKDLSDWRNLIRRRAPGLIEDQPLLAEILEDWK